MTVDPAQGGSEPDGEAVPGCRRCGHGRILDLFVAGRGNARGHVRAGPCLACRFEGKDCEVFVP